MEDGGFVNVDDGDDDDDEGILHCPREIDDYAKDGGPEVVWHLCSFYQEPLRS